jgi:tetratricopeptide (TPR) repeat protein
MDCASSYNREIKLDSEIRCKYPESIVYGNEQTEKNKLLDLEQKYESILSGEPGSNTFCLLADVQYRLGKVDKATGVLIRGLGYNKNNVTARFLLGKIYYERWLIDKAKKEMEKVLELAPDNLEAAKLLSQIYRSEDNLSKALETLKAAHIFHLEDAETVENINIIKNEIADMEIQSSRTAFETPLESRKVNKIRTDNTGRPDELYTETMLNLYLQQGQYDKARETIQRLYENEEEKNAAIENLEKTKLNKMNIAAGFVMKHREDK